MHGRPRTAFVERQGPTPHGPRATCPADRCSVAPRRENKASQPGGPCRADVLSNAVGARKLNESWPVHEEGIRRLFGRHLDDTDIEATGLRVAEFSAG